MEQQKETYMASSKYPHLALKFPFFTLEDSRGFPFQVYPNWRSKDSDPLQSDERGGQTYSRKSWDRLGAELASIEYTLLQYLATVTPDTLAMVVVQGYGAEEVRTHMVVLDRVFWCGRIGGSVPRLDYNEVEVGPGGVAVKTAERNLYWGPLVLCVAPLKPNTPYVEPHVVSTEEDPKPGDFTFLTNFLLKHGMRNVG